MSNRLINWIFRSKDKSIASGVGLNQNKTFTYFNSNDWVDLEDNLNNNIDGKIDEVNGQEPVYTVEQDNKVLVELASDYISNQIYSKSRFLTLDNSQNTNYGNSVGFELNISSQPVGVFEKVFDGDREIYLLQGGVPAQNLDVSDLIGFCYVYMTIQQQGGWVLLNLGGDGTFSTVRNFGGNSTYTGFISFDFTSGISSTFSNFKFYQFLDGSFIDRTSEVQDVYITSSYRFNGNDYSVLKEGS